MNDPLPIDASALAGALPDGAWLPPGWNDLNVAVALSGGADSTALLRVLGHFKGQRGGTGQLLALHVDHQLRGQESDADAQWCQQLCDSLRVPLKVLTCNTRQHAADSGDGIEAAARAERYRLLVEASQQAGVRYLATAHTRDDQIETILFRILRGTGLRGLVGIPPTRALTESLTLIRPLLHCTRADVMQYLADLQQDYRDDSSNVDHRFTRNRLRHELLPLLRDQYNSELDGSLLRLSRQADETQDFVEQQARRLLDGAERMVESRTLSLACSAFEDQPPLVAREAVRIAWREAGLGEQAMTYEWWRRLGELAQRMSADEVLNLPNSVRASIDGERLVLEW